MNVTEEFVEVFNNIMSIEQEIRSMYENTLYEDNWDNVIIQDFNSKLDQFNTLFNKLSVLKNQYIWNKPENKERFEKYFNIVLKEDFKAYNAARIRHNAYLLYRTHRKSIIKFLNDAVGLVRKKQKNFPELFDFFNDRCAKVPLYDNRDKNGDPTVHKEYTIYKWIKEHQGELIDDINHNVSISDTYDMGEMYMVFNKYVNCRIMAYRIFNMITSTSDLNGYEKYHNILNAYCNAELSDKQYERLYQAAKDETEFSVSDDYQQDMDQISWNRKGIYENAQPLNPVNESFLDLFIDKPEPKKANKENITKISAIPSDAKQCQIYLRNNVVYAGKTFYPGDIIEICPTKQINRISMFSNDVRSIVFEIKKNDEYIIPFGYCQFYELGNEDNNNCDYLYDANTKCIVIRATQKIMKNEKLYLKTIH